MKTIGLIGGMSWESTVTYYQTINREMNNRLGNLHSAKIILHSLDFDEIAKQQSSGDWMAMANTLLTAAKKLQHAGADCVLICTNTMHKVADNVANGIEIPLIHIADCTAKQLQLAGTSKVGLLGTKFTMQQEFYKGRLTKRHHINVVTPNEVQMEEVHRIIYQELCKGEISETSKQRYLTVIDELQQQGAQGVILGCTEIGLLIKQKDVDIPLYDTASIHGLAAVDFALSDKSVLS